MNQDQLRRDLIVLLANIVGVPDWTTAVSGLIGIGVGIDYSLLVLTRFQAALNGKDRHDAVVEAVTTAGRSVIIAGATVVIVLGLFLTGLPYMYGVAISASLAVLMMFAAVSLLPALLAYLGPRGRPATDPGPRPRAAPAKARLREIRRRRAGPRGAAPSVDRRIRSRSCSRCLRPRSGWLGFPGRG